MLEEAFEEVTVECGDVINILCMTVTMDRANRTAIIKQKHFLDKVTSTFNATKKAVTPAYGDLQKEGDNGDLLKDQKHFMSLNATLMYAAKRTHLEISFPVVCLSSRYNKATVGDLQKAMRVAEYIVTCGDSHCLKLAPKSLQIILQDPT